LATVLISDVIWLPVYLIWVRAFINRLLFRYRVYDPLLIPTDKEWR
jgi:hypothetical protein